MIRLIVRRVKRRRGWWDEVEASQRASFGGASWPNLPLRLLYKITVPVELPVTYPL